MELRFLGWDPRDRDPRDRDPWDWDPWAERCSTDRRRLIEELSADKFVLSRFLRNWNEDLRITNSDDPLPIVQLSSHYANRTLGFPVKILK